MNISIYYNIYYDFRKKRRYTLNNKEINEFRRKRNRLLNTIGEITIRAQGFSVDRSNSRLLLIDYYYKINKISNSLIFIDGDNSFFNI